MRRRFGAKRVVWKNAGAGVKVVLPDGGLHHAAPMFDGSG